MKIAIKHIKIYLISVILVITTTYKTTSNIEIRGQQTSIMAHASYISSTFINNE
jgi:hypothetical protein